MDLNFFSACDVVRRWTRTPSDRGATALGRMQLRVALGIAAAIAVMITPAIATAAPAEIQRQIDEAASYCADEGGRLRTDTGFSYVAHLDGNGADAWVLDFSKVHCDQSVPSMPYCGSGGCLLTIFISTDGAHWIRAFEDTVQRYEILRSQGAVRLRVLMAGNICGREDARSCREDYRIDGSTFVRIGNSSQ